MKRIFCLANQKGGVGKSTSCSCLAAALAENGYKVLTIDLDPQAGLTTCLGYDPDSFNQTIYNALINPENDHLNKCIIKTTISKVFLVPANLDLSGVEAELIGEINWASTLKDILMSVENDFDFILLDCPPSLGVITTNALIAAELVIVPLQCEYLAMRGLKQLQKIIDKVKNKGNPQLKIKILRTMHDKRTLHSTEVLEEIEKVFGEQVFKSVISRTIKFADSTTTGQPILITNSDSAGAMAYRELAKEILNYD